MIGLPPFAASGHLEEAGLALKIQPGAIADALKYCEALAA